MKIFSSFILCLVAISYPSALIAWEYENGTDAMGRSGIKTASVSSVNTINLGFPYQVTQHAQITIRKHPKYGKDIIFSIERGQLICDYDDCGVTVRFDEKKPIKIAASKPADHSTTAFFLQDFDRFVAATKKAKRLRIEVMFYQQGNEVFDFDVSGLKWP